MGLNWSGALQDLGKGLFAMGQTQIRKEEDEIAFMRTKALQELGFQQANASQARELAFRAGESAASREAEAEGRAVMIAANRGDVQQAHEYALQRDKQNNAAAAGRDSAMKTFQLQLEGLRTTEAILSSTNSMLGDIQREKTSWRQALLKAQGEGADPETIKQYQDIYNQLTQQEISVREAGAKAVAARSGVKPPEEKKSDLFAVPSSPFVTMPTGQAPAGPAATPKTSGRYEGKAKGSAPAAPAATEKKPSIFSGPQPGAAEINAMVADKVSSAASSFVSDKLLQEGTGASGTNFAIAARFYNMSVDEFRKTRPDIKDASKRKALGLPAL